MRWCPRARTGEDRVPGSRYSKDRTWGQDTLCSLGQLEGSLGGWIVEGKRMASKGCFSGHVSLDLSRALDLLNLEIVSS